MRIRNYAAKLQAFWDVYRQDATQPDASQLFQLGIARAGGGAGRSGRPVHGPQAGWRVLLRLLLTPELWVASQIRKRALTMAWTPGLTLDYARALSMLADPRPFGWWQMAALRLIGSGARLAPGPGRQARNAQEAPSSQGA